VLAADQVDLSQRFSQSQEDRFAGIDLKVGAGGTPMLPGCSAWFECRNEIRYPGGDHVILVGYVENFRRQEKPPLVFHGGLMPGALPFATAVIAWLWLRPEAPSRPQRIALGLRVRRHPAHRRRYLLARCPRLTGLQLLGDALFLCGSSALGGMFTLLLRRYPMAPLAATVATTLGSAAVYLPIWWLFLPSTLAPGARWPRSPCRRCIRACWWSSSP
jgi:hypothetical protein